MGCYVPALRAERHDGQRPVDYARRCELLAGAVALVNPVRQAGPFGMVNIESPAMGCPVIGPTFGSFPEIIEPREESPLTAKNAKNAKGDLVLRNTNPSLRS